MTGTAYGKFAMHLAQGVNLLTSQVKAMLVDDSYTLDIHNHEFTFDLGVAEVTGVGYTPGGIALTNRTLTYDPVLRSAKFDADDLAFGSVYVNDLAAVIVYIDQGSPQANILVAHHPVSPQNVTGEAFTYYWHADGVLNFTV